MITKKQTLSLITFAIMMVIDSMACSEKLRNVGSMPVTEAGQTPTPEYSPDNPNNKLTIYTNQCLIQFKDLSFKSDAYYFMYDMSKKYILMPM